MKAHRQRLQRAHFAFMRALIQGLDARASWDRYLRLEGESADMRNVRRTIGWMRDAFAAAARRERRPGTARLILLDPERFASAPKLPTLEDFAHAQGLEDFSHAEQIEAYEAAYPGAGAGGGAGQGGAGSRRARVVARQLEALQWLEGLTAEDPRPDDPVAAWLNPALAARLERAHLGTLRELVERVNHSGARWWTRVPGIGAHKAARVIEWLQVNEQALGLRIGHHALRRRSQLAPEVLHAVVAPATELRPLEKLVLPPALDGSLGLFRSPAAGSGARTDPEAIAEWLAGRGAPRDARASAAPPTLSATQRAYRKEAERLLLWAVLERGKPLSSLTPDDAAAYGDFLCAPPAAWCGPRHHQRWSPQWRPFEGALSPAARRQSLVILRGLFGHLVRCNYLVCNPFAPHELPMPTAAQVPAASAPWAHLDMQFDLRADDEAARRLRRALQWIRATGLRLGEVVALRCGDLVPPSVDEATRTAHPWQLQVKGARGATRQVPLAAEHVRELEEELARHGFEPRVDAHANHGIAVLARFVAHPLQPGAWSASGLHKAMKRFLHQAAHGLDETQAAQLRQLTTHHLRRAARESLPASQA
ncbi:phage integrase family protein [Variovorax sp.]|jgi:integrase|uniref:phage integrase family protein n=1 Tax=Variovorax sp. TaxID=1871043 RepID=UPI0037DA5EFB